MPRGGGSHRVATAEQPARAELRRRLREDPVVPLSLADRGVLPYLEERVQGRGSAVAEPRTDRGGLGGVPDRGLACAVSDPARPDRSGPVLRGGLLPPRVASRLPRQQTTEASLRASPLAGNPHSDRGPRGTSGPQRRRPPRTQDPLDWTPARPRLCPRPGSPRRPGLKDVCNLMGFNPRWGVGHSRSVSAGGVRSVSAVRAPSRLGLKPQAGEYPPLQGGQGCM